MSFALVVFFDKAPGVAVPEAELVTLRAALAGVPDLAEAAVFTPAAAHDAYVADGAPPPLGVQLLFARLERLEAACAAGGPVARALDGLRSLEGIGAGAQAFWRRTWPVPDPGPAAARRCSYVVHYTGPAEDANAWHSHYFAGHPPLFQRFPGIRHIEILTPVVWVSGLVTPKVEYLQRNRVVFDDPAALAAALASPVRHDLRADFHTFPPFAGENLHFPMWTDTVLPGAAG